MKREQILLRENTSASFTFERFEKLKDGRAEAAQHALNEQFPQGSDASLVVNYLVGIGAHCDFVDFKGYFYYCKYSRPGHGLMALVSTIEWQVGVYTDPNGTIVDHIVVGRFVTGT